MACWRWYSYGFSFSASSLLRYQEVKGVFVVRVRKEGMTKQTMAHLAFAFVDAVVDFGETSRIVFGIDVDLIISKTLQDGLGI